MNKPKRYAYKTDVFYVLPTVTVMPLFTMAKPYCKPTPVKLTHGSFAGIRVEFRCFNRVYGLESLTYEPQ